MLNTLRFIDRSICEKQHVNKNRVGRDQEASLLLTLLKSEVFYYTKIYIKSKTRF